MMKKKVGLSRYRIRLLALIKHPLFWTLTIAGNVIILIGGTLLYLIESTPEVTSVGFLDCLLWSAGTVTTVGYGNYIPQTVAGKITILFLMLIGTLFVWSYMAVLVTGLIAPELSSLEKEVHDFEKELHELKSNLPNKKEDDDPFAKKKII